MMGTIRQTDQRHSEIGTNKVSKIKSELIPREDKIIDLTINSAKVDIFSSLKIPEMDRVNVTTMDVTWQ